MKLGVLKLLEQTIQALQTVGIRRTDPRRIHHHQAMPPDPVACPGQLLVIDRCIQRYSHDAGKTFHFLGRRRPLVIPYIFGVAAVPAGFGAVRAIHRKNHGIELVAATGERVTALVDHEFLRRGRGS